MNSIYLPIFSNEEDKKKMKIEELSFDFAKRIVFLHKHLTTTSDNKEFVISKQILRSGTSIGANIAEAEHPQSTADYLNKVSIALKEANETKFWLLLLRDCNYISEKESESLLSDCYRIIKILATIVGKIKSKIKNNLSSSVPKFLSSSINTLHFPRKERVLALMFLLSSGFCFL